MPLLMHLTPEKNAPRIRRAGIEPPSAEVREELAYMLCRFRGRDAAKLLARLRRDPVAEVREAATP